LEPIKSEPVKTEPAKQKRTAADYLREEGYENLEDAADPVEDVEATDDDEDAPVRHVSPVRNVLDNFHGAGGPHCYGNCGVRHKCLGLGCTLRDKGSYARPCAWEQRYRECVHCAYTTANPEPYDGSDFDEYFDQ
jgi:hypothetical protein